MAVVDKFKKYYKMLPVQLTIVNKMAAHIASEIYQAAVEADTYADNDNFNSYYGDRLEKYILYYDIGKSELQCSDIKINRITTDNEMLANRKFKAILDEAFKDVKLSVEDEICQEILYYAAEKNEQYDGMGFPKCLKGKEISPIGKMLSLAEYIARKFIDCNGKDELIKKMKLKRGKKFDPDVVELAVGVVEKLYEQARAELPEQTDEFRSIQMLYQPICDASSNGVMENEGFICLNDEKRGTLMPAFYGPVAERNARIMDITKYGFEFLFADMAKSKLADPEFSRTFTINVSKECLMKATFMTHVKKMIGDYSVNPQKLVLAIDASAIDVRDTKLTECLKSYKELGCKLAMDNYGIDNASLLKLQEIEFDAIRIDRSFIDRICDNRKTYEIVKNIIKMAKDLKIDIVAKGVDTKQQKELLLEMKCFYMQGRLFGEPDYLSI